MLPPRLANALCQHAVSWLVGPTQTSTLDVPALRSAHAMATVQGTTLWRVERASLAAPTACAETPSAG